MPDAYMDEIFHVPQTQKYCDFRFTEWDSKITTLPGLYVFGFLLSKILSFYSWVTPFSQNTQTKENMCSANTLRSVNVVMFFMIALILLLLHSLRKPKGGVDRAIEMKVIRMSVFPLLVFFSVLYYTDLSSTCFVLISYFLMKINFFTLSSIFGAYAVFCRQTNIIWCFFICGDQVLKIVFRNYHLLKSVKGLFLLAKEIFKHFWGFIVVGVSFVVFVKVNKGIVVGDRDNHSFSFHFAQFLYFTVFCCFFSLGNILSVIFQHSRYLFLLCKKYFLIVLLLIPVFAFLGYKFTYIHAFILADNRHYTFYLFRKLFKIGDGNLSNHNASVRNAIFSPIYTLCFVMIAILLSKDTKTTNPSHLHFSYSVKSLVRNLFFFVCVVMNICLSPLVEFRYFILPFLFFSLKIPSSKVTIKGEAMNLLLYTFVNAATLYFFIFKPFGENNQSRFMW